MGYITYNESSGIIKLEKETDVGRRQNGRKQRGCVTAFLSIILAIGCVLLIGIQGMSWISRIPWGQMEAWIQKASVDTGNNRAVRGEGGTGDSAISEGDCP